MKLVVGLGNPGRRYKDTRHNVGFMVLDRLAAAEGCALDEAACRARLARTRVGKEEVMLAKPQTFMNRSGLSVDEIVGMTGTPLSDMLVVCDDFNLPFGVLRIRRRGRSGGQKGLESIMNCLDSADFPRLRVGIGSPPQGSDAVEYVLQPFPPAQAKQLEDVLVKGCQAVATWIDEGVEAAMNRFNSGAMTEGASG